MKETYGPCICPPCEPIYGDYPGNQQDTVAGNTQPDMINSPPHYVVGGLECIDVIEALGLSYHLGTVLKYIWRAGRKGLALEDAKKARWFLDRYISNLEKAK